MACMALKKLRRVGGHGGEDSGLVAGATPTDSTSKLPRGVCSPHTNGRPAIVPIVPNKGARNQEVVL